MLEVQNLSVGYTGVPVVRNLGLRIGRGEIAALLGPNGAGKTTTLRAISRLLPVQSGHILFDGEPVTNQTPQQVARSGLIHMSDRRGIFPNLTVEEHFRLRHRGQKINRDIAFDHFPVLRKLAKRRAALLSGGEQQMLGLGRALAREPKLLLVDELSLGLAPVIVKDLLPVLRRVVAETGAGVLLVEQHVQMALEIADHGHVLVHGDLAVSGDARSLRQDRKLIMSSYLGERVSGEPEVA
ncbi:ABC transporter ATP-binding protein [Amycolatopsis bartoniae]|uniref:ABC transporter ATP-binding protein n=1 Tax=Amycolatopsis bartoniae TaxID=941986 RepID=UPI001E55E975|nr:ABC transporter ATP-binding protein [Amycolatopsis bartoniae]